MVEKQRMPRAGEQGGSTEVRKQGDMGDTRGDMGRTFVGTEGFSARVVWVRGGSTDTPG